jgi:hypothetical protein
MPRASFKFPLGLRTTEEDFITLLPVAFSSSHEPQVSTPETVLLEPSRFSFDPQAPALTQVHPTQMLQRRREISRQASDPDREDSGSRMRATGSIASDAFPTQEAANPHIPSNSSRLASFPTEQEYEDARSWGLDDVSDEEDLGLDEEDDNMDADDLYLDAEDDNIDAEDLYLDAEEDDNVDAEDLYLDAEEDDNVDADDLSLYAEEDNDLDPDDLGLEAEEDNLDAEDDFGLEAEDYDDEDRWNFSDY